MTTAHFLVILLSSVIAMVVSRTRPNNNYPAILDFFDNKNRGPSVRMTTLVRNKRQSHPAATVARFPEFPTPEFNTVRPDRELPELIDYLTPPRPPEISSNDNPVRDFPPAPTPLSSVGSSASEERQTPIPIDEFNEKWDLGYNPSDILNPPADPFSIRPENRYGTVNSLVASRNPIHNGDLERSDQRETPSLLSGERLNFNFNASVFNLEERENKFRPIVNPNHDNQNIIQIETQNIHTTSTPLLFLNKRHARAMTLSNDQINRSGIQHQKKRQLEDYNDDAGERYSDEDEEEHDDKKSKSTGPVYTFVKTDKHGHYKWGVRHGHLK